MPINKIKGKLGFGCMRLPMLDDEIDKVKFDELVDAFLDAGFNYFDTAFGYIGGKSEPAIRESLVKRHPRDSFLLADKLSYWCFENEEDFLPFFEKQLERCGVTYFDFYLFHSMNHEGYEKHKRCHTFDHVQKLKEKGKIKHIAMSFHDTAEFLDKLLTELPFIEVVQLQFNYLDYDDPTVQSKACYDVAVKHGKKVIVMEPVKGGALVNLPQRAADALCEIGEGSQASFAFRFVTSFPEVVLALSGMGTMEMMNDNINTMKNLAPFTEDELNKFEKVRKIIREIKQIQCTKCNYCADVCKAKVKISEVFSLFNLYLSSKISRKEVGEKLMPYSDNISGCIGCGKCETTCPQSIKIREELERIKKIVK